MALAACRANEPGATAVAEDCPPPAMLLSGRVVDRAGLLAEVEERAMTARLAAFEARTKHQIVIATTPDLAGLPIERYSLCLANSWGVGRKGHDDGVMVLVAPTERRVRIEVGRGLEAALTNAEARAIMERDLVPDFRAGTYAKGLNDGLTGIEREIGPVR